MDIPQEIIENARFLSPLNVGFYDYVCKHKEFLSYENFSDMDLHDDLYRLQCWPTFISKIRIKRIQDVGKKLIRLIIDIPDRIFKNDIHEMGRYYNLPSKIFDIRMSDNDIANHVIWRGDFIYSKDLFKCIEINSSANVGGLHIPVWERMAFNNSLIKRYLKNQQLKLKNNDLLQHLFYHVFESTKTDNELLNIVVLAEERTLPVSFVKHLKQSFYDVRAANKTQGDIFFALPNELVVDNNRLFYNDVQIQSILEFKHGMIPHRILELCNQDIVNIFNGPITVVLANKLNLAVLSENSHSSLYSKDEQDFIQKHVPWTRRLRDCKTVYQDETVDLVKLVMNNKDLFVLKPSLGLGGEGIFVGKETDELVWQTKIQKVIKQKNWVIQEYLQPGKLVFQLKPYGYKTMNTVFGFLYFGQKYAGCLLRVMPEYFGVVINAHQGADIGVVIEC